MKYYKTKAHERHKMAVQQAYDFAVTMSYAVPHLATHLTQVEVGQAELGAPFYFSSQNTTQYLKENLSTFESRLSSYMLLSLFSFFEAFVKDVIQEMFDFHGGVDNLLELAARRDRFLSAAAQSKDIQVAKGKLKKNKKGKEEKYKKYSIILREQGYRFPTERLSSYGVRMLVDRHKNLRAHGIPDLLEFGLSITLSKPEKDKFLAIKEKRNKVAHGRPEKLNLAYIGEVNEFFRDMTFRINSHVINNFFVVEEYAY